MSETEAQILDEIRQLARKVDQLANRGRPYSRAKAAKALGIRWSKMPALCRAGLIQTLPDGRIPACEVERLQRTGIPDPGQKERRPRLKLGVADVRIADIHLE